MIRARLKNGDFVVGIDAENVRRLVAGSPIVLDLAPTGGTDRVLILYGPTLAAILAELERANGGPLPPARTLPE